VASEQPANFFQPHPWQIEPWRNKDPVMFLGGSAGGGKSRLAGEKIHGFCLHYPGATAVISRKAEDDMKISTIPLMLETVMDIANEPRCTYHTRSNRVTYENGSELIFKGIWDERSREGIKSIGKGGAADIWWMEEGSEFEEEDFNAVTARMRGTAADWTQIIVSSNPLGKLHWINRRLILGEESAFFPSSALDNPTNPVSYLGMLNRLTGIDRARLKDGLWIDGTGLVIDTWKDDYSKSKQLSEITGNVTTMADYIPGAGPVYWFCDDGYSDGFLSVFANHYEVQILQDPHINIVKELSRSHSWPMPHRSVYDGAAPSLGGYLTKHKCKPIGIRVKIDEGIKELRAWVGPDTNGVRRVIVHPRCAMLRFEMGSYTYDKFGRPIDVHNHGIDALRYGVWHVAYSGPGHVEVAYAADGDVDIDIQAIEEKIDRIMAELERKHADAWS
jgi:hypothetical protein